MEIPENQEIAPLSPKMQAFSGFRCPFARAKLVRAANGLSKLSDIIGIFFDAPVAEKYEFFIVFRRDNTNFLQKLITNAIHFTLYYGNS